MRLLHTGDLHVGAMAHSRPGPDGIPTALASTTRCWLRACEVALQENVDLVLVAGDVFHGRNPGALALNAFEAGLRLLKAGRIPVVLIDGNHDGASSPELPSILQVFDDRPWVIVSSKPEVLAVEGLLIGTLPWVSRQYLATQHDGMTRAEASTAVIDGLQRILDGYRAEAVDVVMGHWTVEGAQLQGSEIDVSITGEAVLPLPALEGFRYVAMSHIHRAQRLGMLPTNPMAGAYSGSIDRLSFGEEGEPKGIYVVELNEHNQGFTFHETPARRFHTVHVGEAGPDWMEQAEGAIVRVLGCEPEDAGEWQRVMDRAGAVEVTVQPAIERTEIRRAEDVTEAMGPLEATDRVLELWKVEDEKRPAIREAVKEVVEA